MRRIFTLVELLVVMAVIAILSALLLPSLQKAKQTAKSSVCQGSLKQMAFGMASYGNDFNDWYAPFNVGHWQTGTDCFEQMDSYIFGKDAPGPIADAFYHCPAEYRGESFKYMSYSINAETDNGVNHGVWTITNVGDITGFPLRTNQIPDFSGTMQFLCDADNASWGNRYCWANNNKRLSPEEWGSGFHLGLLHNMATNWAFCDGHVAWMRWQDSVGPTGNAPHPKGIWTREAGD